MTTPAPITRLARRAVPTLNVLGLLGPLLSLRWALRKHRRNVRRLVAQLRSRNRIDERHIIVATDRSTFLATIVDDLSSASTRSDNLKMIIDLLNEAGIEFLRDPSSPQRRTVVGIRSGDAPALAHAMRTFDLPPGLHIRRGSSGRSVIADRAVDTVAQCETGQRLVFFVPVCDHAGNGLLADEYGTEVVMMADATFGRLVRDEAGGTTDLDPLKSPFPIDVVYTWVDGSDPAWQERMASALAESGSSPSGTADERFGSVDLLRWSLRSLRQNVPWIRDIYLVTDEQTPSWFVPDNGITLVDHRDIFPVDDALPVFNSHAIEANLHRIDGLSEHYLYVNDDVFFGCLTFWTDLFTPEGYTRFAESLATVPDSPDASSKLVDHSGYNARRLLQEKFGANSEFKIKHTPHPQRRSVHDRMEADFDGLYARVSQSRFRSPTDISIAAFLHHRYGEKIGTALHSEMAYDYIDLTRKDLEAALHKLRETRGFWCLNDGPVPAGDRSRINDVVTAFLDSVFPIAAKWEK